MTTQPRRPSVSVVIPAFNAARWLPVSIESVLGQTWEDRELIVVDDGSTDATEAVVTSYGRRLTYVRTPNTGAAAARNRGVALARGEYVAFLDADDAWFPLKLERQLTLFAKEPELRWVYADALVIEEGGHGTPYSVGSSTTLWSGDVLSRLLLHDFVCTATVVARRDALREVGSFQELPLYRAVEDWDLWLRMAARHSVGCVPEPLALYRLQTDSASGAMDLGRRFASALAVVEAALARDPGRLAPLRSAAIAGLCFSIAQSLLKRGRRLAARRMIARAVRFRGPSRALASWWAATLLPGPMVAPVLELRGRLRRYPARKLAAGDRALLNRFSRPAEAIR